MNYQEFKELALTKFENHLGEDYSSKEERESFLRGFWIGMKTMEENFNESFSNSIKHNAPPIVNPLGKSKKEIEDDLKWLDSL